MSTPTSAIHICNLALDRLGQRAVTNILVPTTEPETICARHYDTTRRELFRRFIFNFSKKLAVLTPSGGITPSFGFATAYALPNDFIRLLALGDITLKADLSTDHYEISEGYIFTDYADSDSALNVSYIFDAQMVSKYDPLFVRLFALHLAANMAYRFTLKNSIIQAIRDDAADAATAAMAVAGQEKPPRRIERSRIRNARRMGGSSRDLRYV